jgi:tetratricopeptide (TPR) repeat protein
VVLVVILSVVAVAALTLVGVKIWNELQSGKVVLKSPPDDTIETIDQEEQDVAPKEERRPPRKRSVKRETKSRSPVTKRKAVPDNREEARIQVERLVVEGNGALRRMDLGEAARLFGEAKQIDSTVPEVWYGLGRVAIQRDHYTEAIKNILYALKLSPQKRRWRIYLGQVYMTNGDRDQAVEEWLKVLEKHPGDQDVLKMLEKAGAKVDTSPRGATGL